MNHKKIIKILVLLILVIFGVSYLYRQGIVSLPYPKPEPRPKINLSDVKNITDANNQFAFDYYNKLISKEEGNIFFSPFSISSAFVMTYEGAKDQTANEIRSVFYFPDNMEYIRNEYSSFFNEINKGSKKYKLRSANALWAQQDYKFSKDYFNNIEKYYNGRAENLDFKKNPEGSASTINKWVENQTNNKIKDLISPDSINEMTRLILTNAVYFKGDWVKQFNKDNTKDEDFRTGKNINVKVKMMSLTDEDAEFNYGENSSLQILEMPYAGDELSMLILLPKDDDLAKFETTLSTKNLSDWKEGLEIQRVKVYIPKFKFDTMYSMSDDLKEMGMPIAFSDSADFSGMTASGRKELKIDQAIHKAFIEVYEEGTEAAAATGIMMVATSFQPEKPEIPIFKADHPFVFLIQHSNTGNILFMGRVVDPNL